MEQKRSYSESVVFLLIDQSKTANDWESHFGLSYQKLSMGSEGDDPEIDTFALIYWNHFFEAGPFLFHMLYCHLKHILFSIGHLGHWGVPIGAPK